MLVLTRIVGETISIGDNISVCVLAINGSSIRFGVEAPQDVKVYRCEIYERIQNKRVKTKGR